MGDSLLEAMRLCIEDSRPTDAKSILNEWVVDGRDPMDGEYEFIFLPNNTLINWCKCLWIIEINWWLHCSKSGALSNLLRICYTLSTSSSILTLLSMNFKDNLHFLMHIPMTSRVTPETMCQSRDCTQNQENPLICASDLLWLTHDKQNLSSHWLQLPAGTRWPACLPPQHWRWSGYGIWLGDGATATLSMDSWRCWISC